jgi:splicing factor 3B subunit 1
VCENDLLRAALQARHTGIKIVQQISILLGCAVLPHLKALVDIVKHGLTDENQKVPLTTDCPFKTKPTKD